MVRRDALFSGDPDDGDGADPVLTVSELSGMIQTALEARLPASIQVTGQLGNLTKRRHWYFSLKDDDAVVSCVMWMSAVRRQRDDINDGDAVIATGRVSYYGPQGRTQLYVESLRPLGVGSLHRRFEALCTELREAGYFAPERKCALPSFPRRIAVITSATGAAIQDVTDTAARRCPATALTLVDVKVQGKDAAGQIARAIHHVDRRAEELGIDAIIVTRGGGSMEDLWAFNEREVADAALACHTPLVAAIGHESDTTIIELVADARAATPTQAVMLARARRGRAAPGTRGSG